MTKYLLVLPLVFLAACASADPLTIKNLEKAYDVWESDKRPTIPNDEWLALPDEQKPNFLPAEMDAAAREFFVSAIDYEKAKGE